MQPDAPSSCTDTGWTWPGVARYLSPLAPQLAPRKAANLHPDTPKVQARVECASASLASCDTWATKLVTIRDPRRQPRPGPAYLEHGRPGSAVGAPRRRLAERRAASSPPSQPGTMK
jgi:hypothetical protein